MPDTVAADTTMMTDQCTLAPKLGLADRNCSTAYSFLHHQRIAPITPLQLLARLTHQLSPAPAVPRQDGVGTDTVLQSVSEPTLIACAITLLYAASPIRRAVCHHRSVG